MIDSDERILIGRWNDGSYYTGNFIKIYRNEEVDVGEGYVDANGKIRSRFTIYKTDNTTEREGY